MVGLPNSIFKNIKKESKRLAQDYLDNTQMSFEHNRDELFLRLYGSEPYYDHNGIDLCGPENYRVLDLLPAIKQKLERNQTVRVSKKLQRNFGLHDSFADDIIQNLFYELITSRFLNTTILTNNPLHVSVLRNITASKEVNDRNLIAFKYLTTIVPFVNDIALRDILTLRNREKEAFVVFRHALNQAIDEFRNSRLSFSESDATQLYSDVILPKLSLLNRQVKLAKKDLIEKPLKSIVATGVMISFGLYSGIMPTELSEMVKLYGLSKIMFDLLNNLMEIGDSIKSIRNDQMFFLWKIKNLADKTSKG